MYWERYAWLVGGGGFSGHRYQFRCVRKISLAVRVANCRNLHRLPCRAASHVIYVELLSSNGLVRLSLIFDGKLENVQYSFIVNAVCDTPWWATSRMRSTDDFFVTRFRGALSRRAYRHWEYKCVPIFFLWRFDLLNIVVHQLDQLVGVMPPKCTMEMRLDGAMFLHDQWGEFYVSHTRVQWYPGASRNFLRRAQTSEYPCLHRSSPKARGSDDAHLRYSDHHASVPRRNIGHLMNETIFF